MLIKTNNKEQALHAVINFWLKDKSVYCNNCGLSNPPTNPPCCENPQIGKNLDHCRGVIKQNKELQKETYNDYASNANKNMRFSVSLPPALYNVLSKYCELHGEKLFGSEEQINWFAKKFPQFAIPKKI